MTTAAVRPSESTGWNWEPQPEAAALVDEYINLFLDLCPDARTLAGRMLTETGTRFRDWVDSIYLPKDDAGETIKRIEAVGYEHDEGCAVSCGITAVYRNHLGVFPPICILDADKHLNIAIKAERVDDVLQALGLQSGEKVGGKPWEPVRWAQLYDADGADSPEGAELWAIERHGVSHFGEVETTEAQRLAAIEHLEQFRTRKRDFGFGHEGDEQGFAEIHRLIDAAMADLGRDWACDLFFRAEREYWQGRNRAGRFQFDRQQRLGLGWANHDHHTYRCSRANYEKIIAVFEKLGFFCREKFFAGAEAGWGAQVLEQPVCGFVIFADVDMSPEEIRGDFAHKGFTAEAGFGEKRDLHTVGLWVALHGDSLLQAGMHHLEAQFDWHALTEQLETSGGIGMMDPFTTFPFLRQAFTEGEQWDVCPERLDALLTAGLITAEQAEKFRAEGARGSHLENLERNDGFKGFNQHGVSDIIARTDARR